MARKRKRAWSNLIGTLPAAEQAPNERELEIRAAMDERSDCDMAALSAEYGELEQLDADAARAASERSVKYNAIERLMIAQLKRIEELSGQDMYRSETAGTFSPKHTLHPVVLDEDALLAWLAKTKQTHLLKLPKGKLQSIVREAMDTQLAATLSPGQRALLEPGDPSSGAPPPGVAVHLHTSVHHTGGRRRVSQDDEGDRDYEE